MSQELTQNTHERLSQVSEGFSSDSQQFQELQKPLNESVRRLSTSHEDKLPIKTTNQEQESHLKQLQVLRSKVTKLEQQIINHQEHEQNLRVQKNKYATLFQNSTKQCQNLKQKMSIFIQQNRQLREINVELKQCIVNLKQQKDEYIEKINCLQTKLQLERTQFDNKFNVMRKNAQAITKVPVKNIDNDGLVKVINSKLVQMQKIINKITDIDSMIREKGAKKTVTDNIDILPQQFQYLEKFQSLMLKQSQRIIGLRQYCNQLQLQIQQGRKNNSTVSTGLGKLLGPVIKFCKPEEEKIEQIKKKKDNM